MLTQCSETDLVDLRQSMTKREVTKMTPRLGFCVSGSIKMLLTEIKMTISEAVLDVGIDHNVFLKAMSGLKCDFHIQLETLSRKIVYKSISEMRSGLDINI